jgi:hypothetical protein
MQPPDQSKWLRNLTALFTLRNSQYLFTEDGCMLKDTAEVFIMIIGEK